MTTKSKNATVQKETPKATEQKEQAPKAEEKAKEQEKAVKQLSAILQPTAKTRLNKLETFNILADKYKSVSEKFDEFTHYRAGNDSTNANMKFSSASNYSFTLRNPAIIDKILDMVEVEMQNVVDKAEQEVIKFNL